MMMKIIIIKWLHSTLWPKDVILISTTNPVYSSVESNGNEEALHIPQNHSHQIQFSVIPRTIGEKSSLLWKSAVDIFYSSNRYGGENKKWTGFMQLWIQQTTV